MSQSYSVDALLEFLEYTAQKGLLNTSTAQSRKTAASKILSVLDADETADLRGIDIDAVFQRFLNKNAKDFTPESLATYRSRLKSAVDDFLRYRDNPASFRPSTGARPTPRKSAEPSVASSKRTEKHQAKAATDDHATRLRTPPTNSISLPIALRADLIVRIENLPHDLSVTEAERIAAIVCAYAIPEMGTRGAKEKG